MTVDISSQTPLDLSVDFEKWYKGDKGDPFLFEDFTPEQIAQLQQPALEAAEVANDAAEEAQNISDSIVIAEGLRVTAENARNSSENLRASNETSRITAEQGRVSAESSRATAEAGRVAAEQERVIAEQGRASQEVQAHIFDSLFAEIDSLRKRVSEALGGTAAMPKVWIKEAYIEQSNLVKVGSGTPSTPPDFAGQFYINTSAKTLYFAVGNNSVNDWQNA